MNLTRHLNPALLVTDELRGFTQHAALKPAAADRTAVLQSSRYITTRKTKLNLLQQNNIQVLLVFLLNGLSTKHRTVSDEVKGNSATQQFPAPAAV